MTEAKEILKEYLILTTEQKVLEDKLNVIKNKLQVVKNKAVTYLRKQDEENEEEPIVPVD